MAPSKKSKLSQSKTASKKNSRTLKDVTASIAESISNASLVPLPLSASEQALLRELQKRNTLSVAVQHTEKDNGTSSLT